MIKCPNCGKEIPKDSKYCTYCGAPVFSEELSIYLLAGVTLTFITSSMLLAGAVSFLFFPFGEAIAGIFNISGFPGFIIGIIAGTFASKRKNFPLVITLDCLLVIFAFLTFLGRRWNIEPFILSILGLIFIYLSRKTFHK